MFLSMAWGWHCRPMPSNTTPLTQHRDFMNVMGDGDGDVLSAGVDGFAIDAWSPMRSVLITRDGDIPANCSRRWLLHFTGDGDGDGDGFAAHYVEMVVVLQLD